MGTLGVFGIAQTGQLSIANSHTKDVYDYGLRCHAREVELQTALTKKKFRIF